MVRPIKGTLGRVAICLGRSVLRKKFELRSQKAKGDARGCIEYLLYKMRRQEALPPNMHHIANGGRRWRRVDGNVRIYSIVGL